MTAEAIAGVVNDLRTERFTPLDVTPLDVATDIRRHIAEVAGIGTPVVDATALFRSIIDNGQPVDMYGDHPCIAPPWDRALIGYENTYGNVSLWMIEVTSRDEDDGVPLNRRDGVLDALPHQSIPRWETAEPIDWNDVRWIVTGGLYVGGRSQGQPAPTGGPMHMIEYALGADGEPLDLHWIQCRPDIDRETWQNAELTLLAALNFMNCRNIEIVEPRRPRAEARRLFRTGVTVNTISVLPTGKSARSDRQPSGDGVPLTSVRGHFASYGPAYGRGLLFGKYEGRFWIPQHARGHADLGEHRNSYEIIP